MAIGGGSTVGLGKAIALRSDLPQIAIPTTYAGSEMTDIHDIQHRAYEFTVQPTPGLPERWGVVAIPAEWSFHPDDRAEGLWTRG